MVIVIFLTSFSRLNNNFFLIVYLYVYGEGSVQALRGGGLYGPD